MIKDGLFFIFLGVCLGLGITLFNLILSLFIYIGGCIL